MLNGFWFTQQENVQMKYWTKLLFVVIVLLTPVTASAVTLGAQFPCDTYKNVQGLLGTKHNEKGFVQGQGIMQLVTGQFLEGRMEIWLSENMESFSIVFTNGKLACILMTGKDLKPLETKPSL